MPRAVLKPICGQFLAPIPWLAAPMKPSRISRWPLRAVTIAIAVATAGVVASNAVAPGTATATGGDVNRCVQDLEASQSASPDWTRCWDLMGRLVEAGDYPAAVAILHSLVEADPHEPLAASSFLTICMNDELVCDRLPKARAPHPMVCPGDGSVLNVIPSGLGLTFPADPIERIAYEAEFIADGRAFALIGASYAGATIAFGAEMSPKAAQLLLTFDPFVACTWAAFQTSPIYTPDAAEFPVLFPEAERANMAYLAQMVLDAENRRK